MEKAREVLCQSLSWRKQHQVNDNCDLLVINWNIFDWLACFLIVLIGNKDRITAKYKVRQLFTFPLFLLENSRFNDIMLYSN